MSRTHFKKNTKNLIAISSKYQETSQSLAVFEVSDHSLLIALPEQISKEQQTQYLKSILTKQKIGKHSSIILDMSQVSHLNKETMLVFLGLIKGIYVCGLKIIICDVSEAIVPFLIKDDLFIKNITFKQNLKTALEETL